MSPLLSYFEIDCACIMTISTSDWVDCTDWAPLALGHNTKHSTGFNFGSNNEPYENAEKMNMGWVYAPSQMSTELANWYEEQYLAAASIGDMECGPRLSALLRDFPVFPKITQIALPPPSGRYRMQSFMQLKLRYPLGAVDYDCVAVSMRVNDIYSKYAYLYWRKGAPDPEYIVTAPTYESRDGEYRQRLFTMANFNKVYDHYCPTLSIAETAIIELVTESKLRLECQAFPSQSSEMRLSYINDHRIAMRALAINLIVDGPAYKNGSMPKHYNECYLGALSSIYLWKPDLLIAATAPDKIVQLRRDTNRGLLNAVEHQLMAGEKLVPMSSGALMNPADLGLAAWRELAVSQAASDLVVNFVCGGFAMHGAWALVQGINEDAFENEAMLELYARSRRTDIVMASIREARRGLAGESPDDRQMAALNADLYRSLEYAQKYGRMSSAGLLHFMEHVGYTLETWPAVIQRVPNMWQILIDTFSTERGFTRMLFDLCYAAHCLHTKIGAAHTDLHINNMTLYHWGPIEIPRKEDGKVVFDRLYTNPIVAFVTGPRGEADTYVMPATGTTACLIDYSRSILGPLFRERLDEDQARNIYRDQADRVLRALARYAGRVVVDNQAIIRAAIIAKFDTVFPILCAVDFIAIGRHISELFDAISRQGDPATDVRKIVGWSDAIPEGRRLEQFAENWMLEQLHELIDAAGQNRVYQAPPFPGDAVLEHMFAKWRFPRWVTDAALSDSAALVDAYNYNRPLQYSSHIYERFPPWAQLAEIEKHLGSYKMEDLFERGVEPFLASLEPGTALQDASAEARAAEAKIDGPPPPADPLWAPRDNY